MNTFLRCVTLEGNLQGSASEILAEVKETRKITKRIHEDSEWVRVLDYFMKLNPQENYGMSLSLQHPRTSM
jgi:hypothetical protein